MLDRMAETVLLGAHVPTSGGVPNAPGNGRLVEATAIQIFTRNQRQWACKPLAQGEARAFRQALAGSGVRAVLSHASYLINLASVVPDFLEKSRCALIEEIRRCHDLGIPHTVVHPGAHMGLGEKAGLDAVARSLDHVLRRTRGRKVMVLLEVTAGQGSCLGHNFEQLAGILDRVKEPERLGVCLDTCHLNASGYDIVSAEGYEQTMEWFARTVGLRKLKAIHLNDAKSARGSRLDRHERAGQGQLGVETFRRILNDPRLRGVPMVVETPGPIEEWKKEIGLLRGLIAPAAKGRRQRATA
jgi:deoxyribonuclease IV